MAKIPDKPQLKGLLLIGLAIFVLLLLKAQLFKRQQANVSAEIEALKIRAEQQAEATKEESFEPSEPESNGNQPHNGKTGEPSP